MPFQKVTLDFKFILAAGRKQQGYSKCDFCILDIFENATSFDKRVSQRYCKSSVYFFNCSWPCEKKQFFIISFLRIKLIQNGQVSNRKFVF